MEYKLFEVQFPKWVNPLLIRAMDKTDAIELSRQLWHISTEEKITAKEIPEVKDGK